MTTEKRDKELWVAIDDTFGSCPECGCHDDYKNVRSYHWFFCKQHKVKWLAGVNLFSSWRQETVADWQLNDNFLKNFVVVVPVFSVAEMTRRKEASQTATLENATLLDNVLTWPDVKISYHVALEGSFHGWAKDMGWSSDALREAGEHAIRHRHNEAFIDVGHKADNRRPDIYTLQVDADTDVFYSIERGGILICGYGYGGGGFYG